jgi:starch-binding outer membrane protein, SusD/RagB family
MDVIHMRAAEMYLIEAEALARQNKNAEAQNVLYALVSERDPGYVKSTNTRQVLIDEILVQRRIELFLEGHRWFDMLRNDDLKKEAVSKGQPPLVCFKIQIYPGFDK